MMWWRKHNARVLGALVSLGLNMLVWLPGNALSTFAATSAQIGVGAHILHPPNAITNLSAAAVGALNGDIQLAWSAPRNINGVPISHYLIRYATAPPGSLAATEAWWSEHAATQTQLQPAQAPGVQEFTILHGFTVGVRYYFAVKAVDRDGQLSPIDTRTGTENQAQSYPVDLSGLPPPTPTGFAGLALSTAQIQWTWNNTPSASFFMLNAFPSGNLVGQTTGYSLIESSLAPNTNVTRTLRSGNFNGLSDPTLVQQVYSLAAVPANTAIGQVWFTSIGLTWSNNGNMAGTQYRIERSEDGFNFVSIALSTQTSHTDTGLLEQTTYYYRIRAINGDGLITAPSNVVNALTPLQVDFVPPAQPMGLKGSLNSTGNVFTMSWEPISRNADGTPLLDLQGYEIYRRTTLLGAPTKLTPVPLTVTAFADQVDGNTFYYTVVAVDNSGNLSEPSLFIDSSVDTNVIYLSTDGVSSIVIPDMVNDLLRSGYNKYGIPLTVRMTERPISSATEIIREVKYAFVRSDTGEEVLDLAFSKPDAVVGVGYQTAGGNVVRGAPSLSAQAPTNATPNDLSLYYYNGVTWVKVGGTTDFALQAVKTRTSYLGLYQLRISARSSVLNLDTANVFPRVFSPNGDGFNDRVYFVVENPNDAAVNGNIFDTSGRHVATLPPPQTSPGIGTTLYWDGKHKNGGRVPAGIYHYKIEGEGRSFTGTVVVAR